MNRELSPENVQNRLNTKRIARSYYYLPEIGSTNSWLKSKVAAGDTSVPDGTVVLTNYQSQGRGRQTRRWEAPPDTSLLFSTLFRPSAWPITQANWLVMAACLAIHEAVQSVTGLSVLIKWPNDLVIATRPPAEAGAEAPSWRKIGGMLLESSAADTSMAYAILGIGLNINIPVPLLPVSPQHSSSLLVEMGSPVSRLQLLTTLLARLENHYEAAVTGISPLPAWKELLVTLGETVVVSQLTADADDTSTSPLLTGIARDVDHWGRLLVEDEAGQTHFVAAGDVTLRRRPPANN